MLSQLEKVKDALLTVTDNVWHYEALTKTDQYIVWAEDKEGSSLEGDNYKLEQSIQGTIDYYTKNEDDVNVEAIQTALKAARIAFYLNSVQYEDETQYIHHEWVFEVA
ncbi:hypothetical protein [Lacrimispora sp.]|uniref:hypothetical protein n=1 Tax=Lacrimispora sp. TaxID=2719234 RepID=UPI0032E4052D